MERRANLSLVIMAVLGLLVLCGPAWAVEVNEPIAHWKFDEGSGSIAYDSAGNNDGTVYGATWTTGQIDGALSFDGVDDYVDVGTGPTITGTGTFAVSAWVMKLGGSSGAIVVQRSPSSPHGMYAVGIMTDGRVQFQIYNGGYGFLFYSNVTVNDGLWHHIAAVRTSSTDAEIYVDGSLVGIGSGPAKSLNNVLVNIGRGTAGTSYLNGTIDDVRIYDRALSAKEIWQLYLDGFNSYERAIIQIEDAIADKEEMLEVIGWTLEKERDAYAALEELLESGDYGDLGKRNIIKARQEVHSAIQHQEQSADALAKSIGKLYDVLSALGWEPLADELTQD